MEQRRILIYYYIIRSHCIYCLQQLVPRRGAPTHVHISVKMAIWQQTPYILCFLTGDKEQIYTSFLESDCDKNSCYTQLIVPNLWNMPKNPIPIFIYISADENFMSDGTLETPIDWIPGMRNIRLKDLLNHLRTTTPNAIMYDFMGEEAQNCLKAPTIIFNTFDAFEQEVLEAKVARFPQIYTIGPLPLLGRHMTDTQGNSLNPSLWKEVSNCLQWLDQREPNSVVFVNYVIVTVMSE